MVEEEAERTGGAFSQWMPFSPFAESFGATCKKCGGKATRWRMWSPSQAEVITDLEFQCECEQCKSQWWCK